ncbi:MAG: hypothetical protein WA118_14170 [Carboxydocellales bacterium]
MYKDRRIPPTPSWVRRDEGVELKNINPKRRGTTPNNLEIYDVPGK